MSYFQQPADAHDLPVLQMIRDNIGFVPNFFRVQAMRRDLLEAEVQLMSALLLKEGALTRQQKEYIFLVCSAANLSTYCITAHCEIVRALGVQGPEPEQVAVDHCATDLPVTTKALLNFASKLNGTPTKVSGRDIDVLHTYGYSDPQVMEAVVTVGFAKFANFIAFGLGTTPDFDPPEAVLKRFEAGRQEVG
jgi:uncharacterized peroxidase-related enzyme